MPVISDEQAKTYLGRHISLVSVLKGLFVSYVITVPVFIIFAIILSNADFPDKFISPVVIITTIVSILTAGSTSTKGLKSRGWLNGSIVGLIYMLVIYLVSSIVFNNFSINRYMVTMLVIGIITGAIGGIIGINLKQARH